MQNSKEIIKTSALLTIAFIAVYLTSFDTKAKDTNKYDQCVNTCQGRSECLLGCKQISDLHNLTRKK